MVRLPLEIRYFYVQAGKHSYSYKAICLDFLMEISSLFCSLTLPAFFYITYFSKQMKNVHIHFPSNLTCTRLLFFYTMYIYIYMI